METIDRTEIRQQVVDFLATLGWDPAGVTNADFSRGGNFVLGTDAQFEVGTSYGEVTVRAKRGTRRAWTARVTSQQSLENVLEEIYAEVDLARVRGEAEGWLEATS
jgi:hypothetical protein